MRVRVAPSAGFCWGVRRAMDAALETQARFGRSGKVQTLGPLIHNPQALAHLARRGVTQAASAMDTTDGAVVIRAHGIPLDDYRLLTGRRKSGHLRIANGTCPEVARVQALIRRHAARGGFVIILGQATHAEVLALKSYASSGWSTVETPEEATALPDEFLHGALVVAQTTFALETFNTISEGFHRRRIPLIIRDTICRDTLVRQKEAAALLRTSAAVVVVGGRQSNNTRHLVEIARQTGKPVQWVECVRDLDLPALRGQAEIGVLAGASTPTWTVDEVVEALEQAGRSSWWRGLRRLSRTLQLSYAFGLMALTALLHHALRWKTGWAGPLLPALFQITLCAALPYLDPLGLDRKGQVQEHFLSRHRSALVGLVALAGGFTIFAAAHQGLWCLVGVLGMAALSVGYVQLGATGWGESLQQTPASKDLGQGLAPALLAIELPGLQHRTATGQGVAAFLALFCLATLFHALRHLKAFQEDRILGREILPVAIGSRGTRWLAVFLLLAGMGNLAWLGLSPF